MQMPEFIDRVRQMRQAQSEYEKTRSSQALIRKWDLEVDVDLFIEQHEQTEGSEA